jgi:hypothetical protein
LGFRIRGRVVKMGRVQLPPVLREFSLVGQTDAQQMVEKNTMCWDRIIITSPDTSITRIRRREGSPN